MKVPTPIPKSLISLIGRSFRGSTGDTLWKLLMLVVFITIAYLLAALGTMGALIAAIIVGSLVAEPVQNAISDIWNRDFWVFKQ